MPEKSKKISGPTRRIAVVGIIIAILFWLYESLLHLYLIGRLGSGELVSQIFPPDLNELWMRLLIVFLIVFFSFYVQSAVNKLRDAELRLKEYMDVSGSILIVLDGDCNVSFINRYGRDLLGYNEEDVLGKNWCENFLPERLREYVTRVFNAIKSGEEGPFEFHENHIITKDGEERYILWHNAALRDAKGEFTGIVSSGMDITEKRRMEEALRERLDELERFRKATVGRELRFAEIKEENLRLKAELEKGGGLKGGPDKGPGV